MTTDIITVDEFATRMHLSRATVFNWMQKGVLARGRHYLKQGRVLRFLWSDEVIRDIAAVSTENNAETAKAMKCRISAAIASPINWEY